MTQKGNWSFPYPATRCHCRQIKLLFKGSTKQQHWCFFVFFDTAYFKLNEWIRLCFVSRRGCALLRESGRDVNMDTVTPKRLTRDLEVKVNWNWETPHFYRTNAAMMQCLWDGQRKVGRVGVGGGGAKRLRCVWLRSLEKKRDVFLFCFLPHWNGLLKRRRTRN